MLILLYCFPREDSRILFVYTKLKIAPKNRCMSDVSVAGGGSQKYIQEFFEHSEQTEGTQ